MSYWTKVEGMIEVGVPTVMQNISEVEDYVKWTIDEIQRRGTKITGTEGDLIFYVNARPDEYEQNDDGEKTYTSALITVCKYLRNRRGKDTDEQVEKFLKRLSHFLYCGNLNVKVSGYNCNHTFNTIPYDELYEGNDKHRFLAKLPVIMLANYERYRKRANKDVTTSVSQ